MNDEEFESAMTVILQEVVVCNIVHGFICSICVALMFFLDAFCHNFHSGP